jgi:N-acetylneuraminic acid mutarotase
MLAISRNILILLSTGLMLLLVGCESTKDTVDSESSSNVSTASKNNVTLLESMIEKRQDFELVVLSDGRLLAIGGRGVGERSGVSAVDTTEVYDPVTDKWTQSGTMSDIRSVTSAVELEDGTVLVSGGAADQRNSTSLTEIWDPSTGEWTIVADMNQAREKFGLIRLEDGRVIAIGGSDDEGQHTATVEIYDPAADIWTLIDPMGENRIWHTTTALGDGRILITGGGNPDGPFKNSAEIFDPSTEKWQYAGEMSVSRSQHTATLMADGRVLVVGGRGKRATSEIYDPVTNTWGSVADTTSPRAEHIAIANSDGSVLVAGGTGNLQSMELYDPISNSWTEVGNMQYSRYRFQAYKRDDGSIMLIGGQGLETVLAETEVFNITLSNRTQAELDANAKSARSGVAEVALNATPTALPTATPLPERKTVTNEGMEFNFPEAIESDPSGTTITPLGNPVKLAIGQTVISPAPVGGMGGIFEAVVSDDRESGGTAVIKIKIRMGLLSDEGGVDLTLEADGQPAAKKLGRYWIGVVDLEYDSDNNPIATVVVFKP